MEADRQVTTVYTVQPRGRYHGGRPPSSDDSLHSPTVIPPSALDKSSIMKRHHRRRATRRGVTARSPTMVTLRYTRFVECRWWNDGWSENCRHLTVVGLHDTGPWSTSLSPIKTTYFKKNNLISTPSNLASFHFAFANRPQ